MLHLPLSMGGMGIARLSYVANAAFVSSVGSSWLISNARAPRLGYFEDVALLPDVPALPPKNTDSFVSPQIHTASEFRQSILVRKVNGI